MFFSRFSIKAIFFSLFLITVLEVFSTVDWVQFPPLSGFLSDLDMDIVIYRSKKG